MSSRFSSTISSVLHCRPYRGSGRAIALGEASRVYALFAFEGMYLFIGDKSISLGIFGALASWLNPDQLIQSGGCKCLIAPK
ncbi:hypothetical protein [Anabaena azotica]|uniref:hypothetical protein n=1 Tax=Anabaena azotica TaxID=197653 RepID=UPI0039A5E790